MVRTKLDNGYTSFFIYNGKIERNYFIMQKKLEDLLSKEEIENIINLYKN